MRTFSATLLLAVTVLLGSQATAQTPVQQHQEILKAVETGERDRAIRSLRVLQSKNPSLFAANNYDYLLGRLAEASDDRAGSLANYDAVVVRTGVLAPHALLRLAALARSSGDLVNERERLRHYLILAANTPSRDRAALRLGESFFQSEDFDGAISSLRLVLSSPTPVIARKARLLTAQSLLKNAQVPEARSAFQQLLMQMPDASRPDDFALEAVRALDEIERNNSSLMTGLTEADRLLRASVYQFNRDFEAARQHYQSVVTQNPKGATASNALYQIGRGHYLRGQYDEAIRWFQRVVDEFPESTSARDALGFQAATYNRLKRTDEAVATYKQLIQRFPDSPDPERPYINIIDALHEATRYGEALGWVQQTRARFNNQLGDTLALFAQFRIHSAQSQWDAVLQDAEELKKAADLGGTRVPSGTNTGEVTFIQALALEQLGRFQEAIDLYLAIPDGRHEYFGQRATERLQALANLQNVRQNAESQTRSLLIQANRALSDSQYDSARMFAQSAFRLGTGDTRDQALDILRRTYGSLPAYHLPQMSFVQLGRKVPRAVGNSHTGTPESTADELFYLGLYDEAVPAFLLAQTTAKREVSEQTGTPGLSNTNYSLATLSLRAGNANAAVRFGERVWRTVPADYEMELAPREYVELLYPVAFRDSLLRHAPPRGIDPRFVLAIARQESRYQVEAKSVAAARGMLQFIPETATATANELGLSRFQQDDLYNPDTAILFASQYLSSLFRQFPNQPEAVAAAYNGGPENVARWIARSKSNDPVRYVAEIGFTQTKDYVFRVLANYGAYQKFYDSQLQRQ